MPKLFDSSYFCPMCPYESTDTKEVEAHLCFNHND
jgi:hypothetical protein